MSPVNPASVQAILAATDDHLQALQHYQQSHQLREAIDTVGQLLDVARHLVRWHDQLTPADIARAKAIIEKVTGGAS